MPCIKSFLLLLCHRTWNLQINAFNSSRAKAHRVYIKLTLNIMDESECETTTICIAVSFFLICYQMINDNYVRFCMHGQLNFHTTYNVHTPAFMNSQWVPHFINTKTA